MRTTLDIDDDLLRTAKELARRQGISSGKLVSKLLRQALISSNAQQSGGAPTEAQMGFRPIQGAGHLVTNEEVNRLREAEDI